MLLAGWSSVGSTELLGAPQLERICLLPGLRHRWHQGLSLQQPRLLQLVLV